MRAKAHARFDGASTTRLPARLQSLAALLLPLLWGCNQSRGALKVSDTEGRRFAASCAERGGACSVKLAASASAPSVALSFAGRLIGVCDSAAGTDATQLHPADCRALVCKQDDDCPPPAGALAGSCLNGLCVDPSHNLVATDSVMLCLAGTGPGHAKPAQIERYALGLNCGDPCVVPAPCRRP